MLLPTWKCRFMIRSSLSLHHFVLSLSPGSLLPVTVFDGHSLRVLFHFARDSPPSRPDVLVVIISMLSSAPVPVTNIDFQTTAPKVSSKSLDKSCSSCKDPTVLRLISCSVWCGFSNCFSFFINCSLWQWSCSLHQELSSQLSTPFFLLLQSHRSCCWQTQTR